jgi:hypothetical protein
MLPATLTMAPIHPLRLTDRNEADSAAQAATFKLIDRATHNLILFASRGVKGHAAFHRVPESWEFHQEVTPKISL